MRTRLTRTSCHRQKTGHVILRGVAWGLFGLFIWAGSIHAAPTADFTFTLDAGDPLIVMSQRAFSGFSTHHRRQLEQYGKLVAVNLETIETIGGGSARCMMAEIFSQKK